MDIVEAIRYRKSIRAFKPDVVPQEILKEIMELALRAPSWAN
ncbi:nitroreductase family protein, partial [Chloroflexota bacterium]